jgi:hypothetical protein
LWLRAFPGEASQVREARHWIESLLPDCDARETLALIASEFGANATEHTRSGDPTGQFTVHLAWSPAMVRLAVGDEGSSLPPEAVTATLDAEHGRGLFMVDAMAADWGCADGAEGRFLWADVPWLGQGGPDRIRPNGAMPTVEAIRRLRLACPGIQVGYDGDPAAWWGLLPGSSYPADRIIAPCFGSLSQLAIAQTPQRLDC